ncbi:MAG: YraN family protein [Lautropia sp.]
MSPTRRAIDGATAEARARAHLQAQGLCFVAANVRYRLGELDLVMRDVDTLVFVEVRSRASMRFGGAAASVDHRKQAKLRRAATLYLQQHYGARAWPACRFDVVAFEAGAPTWIRGAFDSL